MKMTINEAREICKLSNPATREELAQAAKIVEAELSRFDDVAATFKEAIECGQRIGLTEAVNTIRTHIDKCTQVEKDKIQALITYLEGRSKA